MKAFKTTTVDLHRKDFKSAPDGWREPGGSPSDYFDDVLDQLGVPRETQPGIDSITIVVTAVNTLRETRVKISTCICCGKTISSGDWCEMCAYARDEQRI